MITIEQIQPFAALLEDEQMTRLVKDGFGSQINTAKVSIKIGKKFARVDVGSSGKYMVDLETGQIFGIKGYGVVHRGHRYGSLDTIQHWNWEGYVAHPIAIPV